MKRAGGPICFQAGQIVLTAAKQKITTKDFIVSGTLHRIGFVSPPVFFEGISDAHWRVQVSFPLEYAPWIEFGVRDDPRYGRVVMRSKNPGYLFETALEQQDRVQSFIASSYRATMRSFR
jgi:hypothetical protein